VLGLVVAIPLLFSHSFVASRSRSLIQILDQQSAGLLARLIEPSGAKNPVPPAASPPPNASPTPPFNPVAAGVAPGNPSQPSPVEQPPQVAPPAPPQPSPQAQEPKPVTPKAIKNRLNSPW